MTYIQNVSGDVQPYDARIFTYDWDPLENAVKAVLQTSGKASELHKALHVENSTKTPVFEMNSEAVGLAYQHSNTEDYSRYYDYLIDKSYPFIVMAGEFDSQDGAAGQVKWMKETLTQLFPEFWSQSRKVYNFNSNGKTVVGGYYQTSYYGNFTFLTVPKSGHFMPADNYAASKQILDDFAANYSLTCNDCDVSYKKCLAMNKCNDGGVCDANGKCVCGDYWKGADCSYKAHDVLAEG